MRDATVVARHITCFECGRSQIPSPASPTKTTSSREGQESLACADQDKIQGEAPGGNTTGFGFLGMREHGRLFVVFVLFANYHDYLRRGCKEVKAFLQQAANSLPTASQRTMVAAPAAAVP